MAKHPRLYNALLLLLFLLAGGLASVCLQLEIVFDFASYHYYNAWAFFNNRWMYDVIPAMINTFFNPLPDVPLYLMIENLNDYPRLIMFLQGLWSGAVAFVLFKIAALFFNLNNWQGRLQVLAVLAVGLTAWPYVAQIGTSSNEMQIALLVLVSWWLLLREIKSFNPLRAYIFFLSGLALGAAVGLKYTAATYCISTGLALLLGYRYFGRKTICWFILGGMAGFLLTNGFWMWRLWNTFGNPVFPLLNNVFKSDYYYLKSFHDTSFYPKNWMEYAFYPFYLAMEKVQIDFVVMFADYRHLMFFIVCIGFAGYCLYAQARHQKLSFSPLNQTLWRICFLNYIVWLALFVIQRYYIPGALLYAIIFVQAATYLYPKKSALEPVYISVLIVLCWVFFSTPYYSDLSDKKFATVQKSFRGYNELWPELKSDEPYLNAYDFKRSFVNMEHIELPQNTTLLLRTLPVAGALPLLNRHSNVQGVLMESYGFDGEGEILQQGKWLEEKKKAFQDKPVQATLFPMHLGHISYIKYYRAYAELNNLECHLLLNNVFAWILCVPPEQVKSVFKDRYHEEK